MEFREMQKEAMENAHRYRKKYNVEVDEDFAPLKLCEEVGEFIQAVLVHKKQVRPEKFVEKEVSKKIIAAELADVVGMCMVNAEFFGIDLEQAMLDKWISKVAE